METIAAEAKLGTLYTQVSLTLQEIHQLRKDIDILTSMPNSFNISLRKMPAKAVTARQCQAEQEAPGSLDETKQASPHVHLYALRNTVERLTARQCTRRWRKRKRQPGKQRRCL